MRERFNEYLDNADRLNTKLKKTRYQEVIKTNRVFVDQARLLFERARELGKLAGIEELVSNIAISERYYMNGEFGLLGFIIVKTETNERVPFPVYY